MAEVVAFLDGPSTMRLEGGLVYVEDCSGGARLKRVMSIHNLIANHKAAEKIIAEWQARQGNVVALLGEAAG